MQNSVRALRTRLEELPTHRVWTNIKDNDMFLSYTPTDHMIQLHQNYPTPISVEQATGDAVDYCVGGGLCQYILEWRSELKDDPIIEVQDEIISSQENSFESSGNIKFPSAVTLSYALEFLYTQYNAENGTDYSLSKFHVDSPQAFWEHLATYLTHRNDCGYIDEAWYVVRGVMVGNEDQMRWWTENYLQEVNTGKSTIFRTEEY